MQWNWLTISTPSGDEWSGEFFPQWIRGAGAHIGRAIIGNLDDLTAAQLLDGDPVTFRGARSGIEYLLTPTFRDPLPNGDDMRWDDGRCE